VSQVIVLPIFKQNKGSFGLKRVCFASFQIHSIAISKKWMTVIWK